MIWWLGMTRLGNYFDKALPFGLRSAPFLFNQLSDALEWLVRNYLNIFLLFISLMTFSSPTKHPPPSVQQLCTGSLPCLRNWTSRLPLKKTFRPSHVLEFIGITLDSVNMQAHRPEDKLDKARSMLLCQCQMGLPPTYLQSLIGTLQFACRVISLGRAFMQCIINVHGAFPAKADHFSQWKFS